MQKLSEFLLLFLCQSAILFFGLGFTYQIDGSDFTVYDMVNSVNAIRKTKGLAEVQINPVLMAVAQDHSDYQASIRRSSHSGRSGGIVTQRVEASSYSGGRTFVAGENVASLTIGTPGMLEIIMSEIWADPVHRGAIVNPKYQDVGVGIASDGEMIYVTLNLAGLTGDAANPTMASPSQYPVNTGNPAILPLYTVTANPDGMVYHTVGYGQTLATIARMYAVDIKDLVRFNQIDPDRIYAGQRLFIKKAIVPTITVTSEGKFSETTHPTELPIAASPTFTIQPTPTPPATFIDTRQTGIMAIFLLLILVLVFLLATRVKVSWH